MKIMKLIKKRIVFSGGNERIVFSVGNRRFDKNTD